MSSLSSYKSSTTKISEGTDEKGKYVVYREDYERPCGCHPETCSHFSEKVWTTRTYKEYENGQTETIK